MPKIKAKVRRGSLSVHSFPCQDELDNESYVATAAKVYM